MPYRSAREDQLVVYRGLRFYPYALTVDASGEPAGFYYRTNQQPHRGALLHRLVWEDTHGPIPEGHVVHHRDGNSLNNDPANLELQLRADHNRQHKAGKPAEYADPDMPSKRSRAMWAAREPRTVVCTGCGAEFQSTGMRAMFCTRPCRRRHYREVRGY